MKLGDMAISIGLSLAVILSAGDNRQEASAPVDQTSILGNPKERMFEINRLLRDAGERVLEQKRMLDDAVARIIAAERRIAGSSLSPAERQNLLAANLAAFREIETIRERIASIQFETARQVFQVEQTYYQSMTADINQKNTLIASDPVGYWIGTRRLLLSPSELRGNLSDSELRAIYK